MSSIEIRDVTLDSVRAQVATVLQADLVFTDSVLVNIGLGDPMHTLPRIIEAAKVAHAHHFIQDLPHGYDTIIGPLGHYLKPDEQFLIALARAFLHDPSILIVEEPNAPCSKCGFRFSQASFWLQRLPGRFGAFIRGRSRLHHFLLIRRLTAEI